MAQATTEIQVKVDTRSAQRNISDLENQLGGLKSAFAALATGAVTKGFVDLADRATLLRNRLNQLEIVQGNTNKAFDELVGIANRSRTSLDSVGDLYFRIGKSAEELGLNQQEVSAITETMAKAITASGISAAEAAGPLLQFGQALQSGRLQGDELRSILEGLPPVARAIADSLGVPVGALRELGAAGVISSRQVADAMLDLSRTIDNTFNKTDITVGQAFTVAGNNLQSFVSRVDAAGGFSRTFSGAILSIAESLNKLESSAQKVADALKAFIYVASAAASLFAVGRIFKILGSLIGFVTKQVTNLKKSFDAIVGVVKRVAEGTFEFGRGLPFIGKIIAHLTQQLSILGAAIGSVFALLVPDDLVKAFESLIDLFTDSSKAADRLQTDTGAVDYSIKELNKTSGKASAFRALFEKDFSSQLADIKQTNEELRQQYRDQLKLAGLNDRQREIEQARIQAYQIMQRELAKLTAQQQELQRAADAAGGKDNNANLKLKEFNDLYKTQVAAIRSEYEKTVGVVTDLAGQIADLAAAEKLRAEQLERQTRAATAARDALSQAQKKLQDLDFEQSIRGLSEFEQGLRRVDRDAAEGARAAVASIMDQFKEGDEIPAAVLEQVSEIEKLYQQLAEKTRANAEANKIEQESFVYGWQDAFKKYTEAGLTAADRARSAFGAMTKGLEDLFVTFARTGKLNFRDFANTIIQEMIRIEAKAAASQILKYLGGGSSGGGGIGSILGSLFGGFFADGGTPPVGKASIVGERGPELFVPKTAGTIVPNGAMGGVTYNITNNVSAIDGASVARLFAENRRLMLGTVEQARRELPIGARA